MSVQLSNHSNGLKIKAISAVERNLPLRKPFKFATYELTYLPYAWVRVETESGLIGYGECPTYWDPSGETQLAAIGAIRHIQPSLIGIEAYDLERMTLIFDGEIYGAFAAKCGLDMALYDIVGKHFQMPVYQLLGGGSAKVVVNGVVPLGVSNIEEYMADLVANDYHIFKVKVGVDLKKELDIVATIMKYLPQNSIVFVDANQGWENAKSAIRAIRQFEALGIDWVEQPVLAHDIEGLRLVRENTTLSVMADESLYSPFDAIRLIREQAADMFALKLAKTGGMYSAKQVYSIARAGNIKCSLGSMIESSLGMLANYHFARAHPMATCGMSAWRLIEDDIDVGLIIEQAELKIEQELPGLGYPDEAEFEKYF